ncbi:PTS sugar transporter subunit IIB [Peribacillus simplex]|uniref:PTS system mannose/fructose/N-acetylgalactosamine-transporter subunit IIB n=1 Tax=Peribacillus simplex TaxID=1478 RepID=UPI0025A2E0F4|nr:PTS sugar transporter subunit IIB [Peribacillus simplex]MDM5294207.1 PTS sugar transporter subunit IIB [Peribacillus simplex]
MSIVVTRIDERLIHGQVAYSWSVAYQVTEFIVIDDGVANDPSQLLLLSMAVPSGKRHAILSVEDAVKYFDEQSDLEKTLIVVKSPRVLLSLIEKGIILLSINVGGMYYKEGKQEISKTVFMDEEDKAVFLKIRDHGIPCEIRTSPNDKSINLFTKI